MPGQVPGHLRSPKRKKRKRNKELNQVGAVEGRERDEGEVESVGTEEEGEVNQVGAVEEVVEGKVLGEDEEESKKKMLAEERRRKKLEEERRVKKYIPGVSRPVLCRTLSDDDDEKWRRFERRWGEPSSPSPEVSEDEACDRRYLSGLLQTEPSQRLAQHRLWPRVQKRKRTKKEPTDDESLTGQTAGASSSSATATDAAERSASRMGGNRTSSKVSEKRTDGQTQSYTVSKSATGTVRAAKSRGDTAAATCASVQTTSSARTTSQESKVVEDFMELIMTLPLDQRLALDRLKAAAKAKTADQSNDDADVNVSTNGADDGDDIDVTEEESGDGYIVRRGAYSISHAYPDGHRTWTTLDFPASSSVPPATDVAQAVDKILLDFQETRVHLGFNVPTWMRSLTHDQFGALLTKCKMLHTSTMQAIIEGMQTKELLNADWWLTQKPHSLNVVMDLFAKQGWQEDPDTICTIRDTIAQGYLIVGLKKNNNGSYSVHSYYNGRATEVLNRTASHGAAIAILRSGLGHAKQLVYSLKKDCEEVLFFPVFSLKHHPMSEEDHQLIAVSEMWVCMLLGNYRFNKTYLEERAKYGLPSLSPVMGANCTPCMEVPQQLQHSINPEIQTQTRVMLFAKKRLATILEEGLTAEAAGLLAQARAAAGTLIATSNRLFRDGHFLARLPNSTRISLLGLDIQCSDMVEKLNAAADELSRTTGASKTNTSNDGGIAVPGSNDIVLAFRVEELPTSLDTDLVTPITPLRPNPFAGFALACGVTTVAAARSVKWKTITYVRDHHWPLLTTYNRLARRLLHALPEASMRQRIAHLRKQEDTQAERRALLVAKGINDPTVVAAAMGELYLRQLFQMVLPSREDKESPIFEMQKNKDRRDEYRRDLCEKLGFTEKQFEAIDEKAKAGARRLTWPSIPVTFKTNAEIGSLICSPEKPNQSRWALVLHGVDGVEYQWPPNLRRSGVDTRTEFDTLVDIFEALDALYR
ncbi:unnamed protein product [Jaminaea pallidilutea]